jgi:hypothetical protein
MAWEDTNCPCGDRKERETMLCTGCEASFASHPAMATFKDLASKQSWRRSSAIQLCAMARRRKQCEQVRR